MSSLHHAARGLLSAAVSPGVDQVTLTARFGHDPRDPRVRALSAIPQAVVIGLETALREPDPGAVHDRLALVAQEQRGFAYEGATMAATLIDALPVPRRGRGTGATAAVMGGPGLPHLFLTYIGIGFAMARLPRRAWAGALPAELDSRHHPTLSWLAVDGLGFDLAYFRPERYLRGGARPAPYPWAGGQSWYVAKAADQGVGRALWFAHAGRCAEVARAIEGFAPERREDLWAGVGLAAAFAGQADDVGALATAAGWHAPDAAVGAVFAATARHAAGPVPAHTVEVLQALGGLDVAEALHLVDTTEVGGPDDGPVPHYAVWRDGLRARLEAGALAASRVSARHPATTK